MEQTLRLRSGQAVEDYVIHAILVAYGEGYFEK